eukprot:4940979-Prymnesium_polylepis.2
MLRSDIVAHQQPSYMEELLRTVRSSAFDLQAALRLLLPLLFAFITLAHYVHSSNYELHYEGGAHRLS